MLNVVKYLRTPDLVSIETDCHTWREWRESVTELLRANLPEKLKVKIEVCRVFAEC